MCHIIVIKWNDLFLKIFSLAKHWFSSHSIVTGLFSLRFTKVEQPLHSYRLEDKEESKDKKHIAKLIGKNLKIKGAHCLLKGKYSAGKKFQSLPEQGKKL